MEIHGVTNSATLTPKTMDVNQAAVIRLPESLENNEQAADLKERNTAIDKNVLETSVQKTNDIFQTLTTHLKFQVHEDTGRYYVKVINDKNNEVIREIPAKKFLDMVASMEKLMKGVFINKVK